MSLGLAGGWLPAQFISASDHYSAHLSGDARLDMNIGGGGWCAAKRSDKSAFWQVAFVETVNVTEIVIQAEAGSVSGGSIDDWITSFHLSTSNSITGPFVFYTVGNTSTPYVS